MLGWVRGWSLWRLPPLALALVILVDLAAAVLPWTIPGRITRADVGLAALLASLVGAYIGYCALSVGWRQARADRHLGDPPVVNVNLVGAWTLAAAISLPPELTLCFIALVGIARWPRALGDQAFRQPYYRYVYSQCNVVVSALGAYLVATSHPSAIGLISSALTYGAVNLGLVIVPVALTGRLRDALPFVRSAALTVELGSLMIGIGEIELARLYLPLIWISVPVAIGIEWACNRSTTPKGDRRLLQERVWRTIADTVVTACPTASIVRIDTDSPPAVAEVARRRVGCDTIGRFGPGGLVILLADCPAFEVDSVVQRLRSALATTGSITRLTTASKPQHGQRLADLLLACQVDLNSSDAA